MTETFSKSRQKAEVAFSKTQSQFIARDHAVEEQEFLAQAREAKTLRLREARLAKEAGDRAKATARLSSKRAAKP
jgi:hypothetical protein